MQSIIPEESSKENSSESGSNNTSTFKERLVKDIQAHSLTSIVKIRLRHDLYQMFYNKYSVQTFEQNQVRLHSSLWK